MSCVPVCPAACGLKFNKHELTACRQGCNLRRLPRHSTPCDVQRQVGLPGFPDQLITEPTGVLECSNGDNQWR